MIQDLIHDYDTMILEAIFVCITPQGMSLGTTSQARLDRAEVMFRPPATLRRGGAPALFNSAPVVSLAATTAWLLYTSHAA